MAFNKGKGGKESNGSGKDKSSSGGKKPEATDAQLKFFGGGFRLASRLVSDPKVEEVGDKKITKVTAIVEVLEKTRNDNVARHSHIVICWNDPAKAASAAKKGDFCEIEGHFEDKSWKDNDGTWHNPPAEFVCSRDDDSFEVVAAP